SGPLGSDLIVAEELAQELGEDRRAMVAPAIPFGISAVHAAFPGTIAVRPSTLLALVHDALQALHAQGFRRFLLVNAHRGSPGARRTSAAAIRRVTSAPIPRSLPRRRATGSSRRPRARSPRRICGWSRISDQDHATWAGRRSAVPLARASAVLTFCT